MKRAFLFLFIFVSASAQALTLDEYLHQVAEKNGQLKAVQSGQEAASAKREAGDMELATTLTASVQRLDDQKPQELAPGFVMTETAGTSYSLGLAKKFSTGTQAQLTGAMSDVGPYFSMGTLGSAAPPVSGSVTLSLSQSLWKNFFGNATRLRREREAVVETAERGALDLQGRQVLIDAEASFWDCLYMQEEVRQREDSLARAKKIEAWVRRRASNGIGDKADVLNAEGLTAKNELDLLQSRDNLRAAQEKVLTALEIPRGEASPPLKAELEKERPILEMVGKAKLPQKANLNMKDEDVVQLDAYLAILDAKAKAVGAKEAEDAMRPDLVLSGKYGTNSYEDTWNSASSKITDPSKPTKAIGVSFTYMLDGDLKDSTRNAARMQALSAAQTQEHKLLESRSAWQEFIRRHKELGEQVNAAEKLSRIQTQKAAAQRDKLSKGRSITSDVITAEQDASNATLVLSKLRAEQRKMEARARLFVRLQEAP